MLKVIRRLFSFSDWEASHPSSPPPGQWLDGQFNEIIDQVDALDARFRAAISADGRIAPGSVTKDSLDPAFFAELSAKIAQIGEILLENARQERQKAENAANVALFAQNTANEAKNRVIEAETAAEPFHSTLQTGLQTLSEQVEIARSAASAAQAAVQELDEMEDYAGYSEAWAKTSALWAEHMPDTLPASALVSLDISGDHWSSRWWANRAAHSFGKLTELYLGAHPTPPTTSNTGGPIVVGSIYYDTTTGQAYVWNGTGWVPLWTPASSNTLSLWYAATAAQTAFPTSAPDVNGNSFVIDPANPEGVEVHVNGLLKEPDLAGPGGDYTINPATSTITFLAGLTAGDRVAIDIMSSPADMRPGAMNAWALDVIEDPDGVLTLFTVDVLDPSGPATATIGRAEELLVSVDGVIQKPGDDYQAAGATLTFSTAPAADSVIFATWFQALGGSPTGDMTPAEILAAIKTVDGPASGIDADLLDGQHGAFYAPIASPTFTGDPKAPTPATADNDTSIATTAYVVAKLAAAGVGGAPAWADITGKPATFPPTVPIAQADIANLTTDLAGKVADTGDTMTGDLTITKADAALHINKAASGQEAILNFKTGGATRWKWATNTTAEGGSNAGSNLALTAYDDAGTTGTIALTFTRSSYGATFGGNVVVTKNSPTISINKNSSAAQNAALVFGGAAGSRWAFYNNNTTESGGNVGQDLELRRYDNSGVQIDVPILVTRSTGATTFSGDLTISKVLPVLGIDKTLSGDEAALYFRTGGLARWKIQSDTGAESGSNAGSAFRIVPYNDAGAALTASFSIARSSGNITLACNQVTQTGVFWGYSGTAIPAGGTTGVGFRFSSTANFGTFFGSGAPTLSAAKGSLYLRSDGADNNTRVYVNTNGTTGWVALSAIAVGTVAPSSPATGDVWIDTT